MTMPSRPGIFLAVTLTMLGNPAREGGFMPGELALPEDRPSRGPSRAERPPSDGLDAGFRPAVPRIPPATDRDYWRWYGRTYIGGRVVLP